MRFIKLFSAILFFCVAACSSPKTQMKTNFIVSKYKDHKMLKGIINRSLLENDTAFSWFKENSKFGEPDANAVASFKAKKESFTMIVFGGTWCEDTQNLLPRFYKLVDASGFSEKRITLIAVDRQKQTVKNLNVIYNITNVPTFIVLKDGKEVGRVVEYGKEGDITKELGEIVATIK